MKYILFLLLIVTAIYAEEVSKAELLIENAEVKAVPTLSEEEKQIIKDEEVEKKEEIELLEENQVEVKEEEQEVVKIEKAKEPKEDGDLVEVKDTSGLSDAEVAKVANKIDEKNAAKSVSIQEIFDAVDAEGDIDIKKLQAPWEELSPKTAGHDWIKTISGEWFKGEIKAMYDEKLEFDSDEVGLYTFDFDDIVIIKSHKPVTVNIEDVASFSGVLRFKDGMVTIIQGDKQYTFPRSQIVSLAPTADKEINNWSGKASIGIDVRRGNRNQIDYVATINLKRRTDKTRLYLDYLGRISKIENSAGEKETTANDHRINQKFDVYLSRHFFWTPVFSEFYTDEFQNIDSQTTVGVGLGYMFIDTKRTEWSVSGGPGVIHTKYMDVAVGEKSVVTSPSLELSTKLEYELNSMTDIKYDYKLTFTDKDSGEFKHHMVLKLENELTSWMDLDISMIWDRIAEPEKNTDGTVPESNDFQLLISFGLEF
jgi:putative salt-induced outer membrane protein YdiY